MTTAPRVPAETTLVAAAIGVFFLLQLHLAFVWNINWDEFYFLSHICSYQAGRLDSSFQTFHVHIFGWLAALPLSEPDQIIAGRVVLLFAEAATAWCIFRIAEALSCKRHALFALFAYLASGYVIGNGASFRTDPIATFMLMASLALLFTMPARWFIAALAGMLAGIGLLVTVKGVFYIPAFVAALIHVARKQTGFFPAIKSFTIAGVGLALTFGIGMTLHAAAVSQAAAVVANASALQVQASSALTKTVLSQHLFPRADYILRWLGAGIVPVALLLLCLIVATRKQVAGRSGNALVCLLLAAPLLSLVFYRNAFPYFFPFILAPVAPVIALASQRLDRAIWRHAALAPMFAGMVLQYAKLLPHDQQAQRQVIAAVHQIFPEPVAYIDRNGMVPSFPKVGFFMSTWGMEHAKAAGAPLLSPIIAQQQPPLLIANSPVLTQALQPSSNYAGQRLHPEDEKSLRENFVHYWGPIWLAGKAFAGTGEEQEFQLPAARRYVVKCVAASIVLNGRDVACGSAVLVATGKNVLRADKGVPVDLVATNSLPIQKEPFSNRPIYFGF